MQHAKVHSTTAIMGPQTEMTHMVMQPSVDPAARLNFDYSIAQTMGPWIFNLQDPFYVQHQNIPRNLPHSWHWQVFLATAYLTVSITISVLIVINDWTPRQPRLAPALITIQGIIAYLVVSFCFSQTLGFLKNVKPAELYQQCYAKMVESPPKFQFSIECYHFESRKNSKGRTTREKVISHIAKKYYEPAEWIDESGILSGISQDKDLVFLRCHPTFYFNNKQAQKAMEQQYKAFIDKNWRDEHQNTECKFMIPGFEQEIAYNTPGQAKVILILFYVMTCIGLGFFYCKILEFFLSRYEIYILKRINK